MTFRGDHFVLGFVWGVAVGLFIMAAAQESYEDPRISALRKMIQIERLQYEVKQELGQ